MFSPPLDICAKLGPILNRLGTKTAPELNTIFFAFISIFFSFLSPKSLPEPISISKDSKLIPKTKI